MDAIAQAMALMQGQRQHGEAIGITREQFDEAAQQKRRHHVDALEQEALHFRKETELKWELYAKERVFSLDVARREAVRDVWQQRNECIQTLLVVATLLFACAYCTNTSGTLPSSTPIAVVVLWSVSESAALFVLLLTIVSLVILHRRVTQYDIHRQLMRYKGCNRTHADFNDYYRCHCQTVHTGSMALLYLGSGLTYFACSAMLLAKLKLWFHDSLASLLYALPLAFGLAFIIFSIVWFPDRTRLGGDDYGGLSGLGRERSRVVPRLGRTRRALTDAELREAAQELGEVVGVSDAAARAAEPDDTALIHIDSGDGSVPLQERDPGDSSTKGSR